MMTKQVKKRALVSLCEINLKNKQRNCANKKCSNLYILSFISLFFFRPPSFVCLCALRMEGNWAHIYNFFHFSRFLLPLFSCALRSLFQLNKYNMEKKEPFEAFSQLLARRIKTIPLVSIC